MRLDEKIAELEKRVLALKAKRNVNIGQVNLFEQVWPINITLTAEEALAVYIISVECGGDPIVDISVSDIPTAPIRVMPIGQTWFLDGNTASAEIWMLNQTGVTQTVSFSFRAWALNGLSATCERIF